MDKWFSLHLLRQEVAVQLNSLHAEHKIVHINSYEDYKGELRVLVIYRRLNLFEKLIKKWQS